MTLVNSYPYADHRSTQPAAWPRSARLAHTPRAEASPHAGRRAPSTLPSPLPSLGTPHPSSNESRADPGAWQLRATEQLPPGQGECPRSAEPVKGRGLRPGLQPPLTEPAPRSSRGVAWGETAPGKEGQLGGVEWPPQIQLAPLDHVFADVAPHRHRVADRLDAGKAGQLIPDVHPGKASQILDAGEHGVVVNDPTALILQRSHP